MSFFQTPSVAYVLAFIILITNKKRESILAEISSSFISLYKSKKNITRSDQLQQHLPLDDSMRKELLNFVKAQNNSNIELIEKVDESLIGGAIITNG